jgi:hypothetical protein
VSKYTPEQLKEMAKIAVTARNNNDERYSRLVISLSIKLNMNPGRVDQKIKEMAQ